MSGLVAERGTIDVGALRIDLDGYRAWIGEHALALSRTKLELLALLAGNRHRVLARGELAQALGLARARSVDVLLTGLRAVLGHDFVRNVRSRGWILEPAAFEA